MAVVWGMPLVPALQEAVTKPSLPLGTFAEAQTSASEAVLELYHLGERQTSSRFLGLEIPFTLQDFGFRFDV